MLAPIEPATLEFSPDGTPWSARFGDIYHSNQGGLGQSRHVFLAGNDLPARWQGRERFVIVEIGFGLGLNFLATWAAWRGDPARADRLHFIAVERHPFSADDLRRAHARWPELGELASGLHTHWPALTPGMHRLWLDGGRVALTLCFGAAEQVLPQLVARADAFYLDGFAPARNPELWSARLCHQLAALAKHDATLATWSVAGQVRRHLEYARWHVARAPGFGDKRHMLRARYCGKSADDAARREREAVVLGAGLSGTSVAQRLAARGWSIRVVDGGSAPGNGASGNHVGILRPHPSVDDNRLARLSRAGALAAVHHLKALEHAGHPVRWAASGVLHLARDAEHEARQRAIVEAQQPPVDFLRFVALAEAQVIAGWPVTAGGWWFPSSGWVQPPSLCAANLAAAGIAARFNTRIERIEKRGETWRLFDTCGQTIAETRTLIVANGADICRFDQTASLPVRSARGQITHLAADRGSAPRVVVCRQGYVSPEVDGVRSVGASFLLDDDATELREAEHAENLNKLDNALPGFPARFCGTVGRVGFRPVSLDRLPIVGAMPQPQSPAPDARLSAIARQPGLFVVSGFGARGLVWSALVAETLASDLDGDPLPLERDLQDAIDPARFLVRRARRVAAAGDTADL